jgi:WXG100 family type VII secretion target
MDRSVEVVVSELHTAAARLRDAGQRLQDGLSSVDLETSQLLGSGWKGDAATAFGGAWDKWHNGAGQVVRGLQSMSDLLTVAGKEYAKTDEQAAAAVGSSFQPTGGTSGGGAPGATAGAPPTTQGAGGAAGGQGGTGDLAQLMNLTQPVSQLGGQLSQGLAQAGQLAAGLAQAAEQAVSSALDGPSDDGKGADAGTERHGDGPAPVDSGQRHAPEDTGRAGR